MQPTKVEPCGRRSLGAAQFAGKKLGPQACNAVRVIRKCPLVIGRVWLVFVWLRVIRIVGHTDTRVVTHLLPIILVTSFWYLLASDS